MVFTTPKFLALFVALVLVGAISVDKVNGAGECGRTSPDTMAFRLAPCASAAGDANAQVSSQCCSQVQSFTQNPGCLCAVLLSNTAKSAGIKPEIAITIPKRCNLANRPVGYKCGAYTLP
ncbi:putative lipid-transfer protein DIR1 [Carex littledalei]|uniref:Putative lipid-transfer protein DIR1 n=1 Tax=Carex littledalei TaxID=544730 RepID=A0A833R6H1_9POAL|nr:putative lipid-transfer protein DIR1 [Carex littledalei]